MGGLILSIYGFVTLVLFIAIVALAIQRDNARAENRHTVRLLDEARANHEAADKCLDFVLRTFSLNVQDPYIVRPGFAEKRCYHCFYPVEEGHDRVCPWSIVRPFVERLYKPFERPTAAPKHGTRA